MSKLGHLHPQPLFSFFESICQVPRPSKKEEKIRTFLLDFARKHNLQAKTDHAGNVLISKQAAHGKEKTPTVVLQTHMDMVCEKNSDKIFDFDNDPIEPIVTKGWVKANGTTLGADCGIGIAAQLAVLASDNISHGPLECLITVDEETGLTGAFALEPGFLKGSILLNLDSEDEGELFIGCAGVIDTIVSFEYRKTEVPKNSAAVKISVSGLLGGHSGDDIHKNRGNAIKILTRFLYSTTLNFQVQLEGIDGGNLRNAIAREASAVVVLPENQFSDFMSQFSLFNDKLKFEFEYNEPNLILQAEKTNLPPSLIDEKTTQNLLNALYACPHGVLEMSTRMDNMVETSTNLASIKMKENNKIIVTTSQRSELESRKFYAAEIVKAVFELANANVTHSEGYPGWTPNQNSKILEAAITSYEKLFGKKPVVRSIHAGLECGLFLEKYPHLDMVSFGPTIKGAHSPDERLDIESTEKFWKHLIDLLETV